MFLNKLENLRLTHSIYECSIEMGKIFEHASKVERQYKKIILVPLTFFILSFCLPFIIYCYMSHSETGNANAITDKSQPSDTDTDIGTQASTSL